MSQELSIEISSHAKEQMFERGVSENEVRIAIRQGEEEPARKGRFMVITHRILISQQCQSVKSGNFP